MSNYLLSTYSRINLSFSHGKGAWLITNDKKKYGLKILDLLNPLLTNYVEKNNINFVLDKKIF